MFTPLKEVRLRLRMSQSDAADWVGVSLPTYRVWESEAATNSTSEQNLRLAALALHRASVGEPFGAVGDFGFDWVMLRGRSKHTAHDVAEFLLMPVQRVMDFDANNRGGQQDDTPDGMRPLLQPPGNRRRMFLLALAAISEPLPQLPPAQVDEAAIEYRFRHTLIQVRNQARMSQAAAAHYLGIPLASYCNWEQGIAMPRPSMRAIVCMALARAIDGHPSLATNAAPMRQPAGEDLV